MVEDEKRCHYSKLKNRTINFFITVLTSLCISSAGGSTVDLTKLIAANNFANKNWFICKGLV